MDECVSDETRLKILLIDESTYEAGVVVFVKVQVNPPHNYVDIEPETLSYHLLTTEDSELPTLTVISGKLSAVITANKQGSTTII
jgi:hypothetical protein